MSGPAPSRRYDLDWLRIAAFLLLIFYHVGMVYVTWDYHAKSAHAGPALEPLMLLLNPWRLGLLFFISGVATRFMVGRSSLLALGRQRFNRLFWPLAFGMLVIVPPQSFVEISQKIAYSGTYWDFYGRYLTGAGDWRLNGASLSTPTWNHLWFVAYMLAYTGVLLALLGASRLAPRLLRAPRLPLWLFLAGPWLYLWACRHFLFPAFESTHALVDDWYNHAVYFFLFTLGFAVAKADAVFDRCAKARWPALILAAVGYVGWTTLAETVLAADPASGWLAAARGLRELQAWATIVALLGFARRHLAGRDGPARRWLAEAVFPFYIVHQTLIVVGVWALAPLRLPAGLEAGMILALTAFGCLAAATLARHTKATRIVLGLKP